MTKKLNKRLIIIPILIAFFMQIMLLGPRIVYAATPMKLAADMYIGWRSIDGLSYPVYGEPVMDGGKNVVSYVGCIASTKTCEEGAALKFNLDSIHGNITSATLKIYVSEINGNPILNLIKTDDDSWNTNSSYKPNYNTKNIINNYANLEISTEGLKTFDVTTYINKEHDGDKTASFILTGLYNNGDNEFAFICDHTSENKPVLDIEYVPYNVIFNSQGGSSVAGTTADYNTTITKPEAPTKPNYIFGGWYKEAACTNPWNFATDKIADNTTLYAKWDLVQYNVTFDSQGGTSVTKIDADYDSTITEPEEPTKIGHTFGGWYKEPECTNPWNFGTDKIAGDVTLYAKWTISSYTVSFDVNYGSPVKSQTVVYGNKVVEPAAPTKTGYNFAGWYTDSTFAAAFDFENTLIASDTTIYAKWTPISYNVTFNTQGGSEITGIKANYDSTIAGPTAPTKPNYIFGGWYKEAACTNPWNFATDKIADNTTLYAKWNPVQYNVTFDYQDGTPVTKITAVYDSTITEPNEPTKIGHTFGGWYKEPECTNPWNFGTDKIAGDMILYAKWTINSYTVSFDVNYGSSVKSQTINYGGKVVKPAAPTKKGYNFAGWYTDSTFAAAFDFENTLIASDTTIYAKWTPISYNVTFNTQGGSEITGIKANYDSTIAGPTAPTKPNYIFGGWYKEAACTNPWNFATDKIADNTTLYAKWNPVQYNVTFDYQDGTPVTKITAAYDSTITEPNEPTKIGHTFGGWYKEPECTNPWNFGTDKIAGDMTLYAKWTISSYTVSFDVNYGSSVKSQTVAYGNKAVEPAAPTKKGYNFADWYTDSSFTTIFDFKNTLITSDITIYAKWTPVKYNITFDSQGGTPVKGIAADYDSKVAEPAAPTKSNYSFGGWYKEMACITPWSFAVDKVMGDTTLYAKWMTTHTPGSGSGAVDSYNVTFNTDGGSYIPRITVNYGSAISEPNTPTKAGYAFGGWYKDPECTVLWNFTSDRVIRDITLYSKWITNSCKVNFETNGGASIDEISTNYGSTISAPNPPTKTGYTFDGWYKDAERTIPWNFASDRVTENVTLYAKWVVNSCKVVFETNGGTQIDGINVNYGSAISVPSTPQKLNCTFGGWYKDSGFSVPWNFTTDKIIENTTLYAKWIMNIYTVSYSGNGNNKGSVPIDKNKYKSGDNIKVMGNVGKLLKYGCTFAGWNTKADGTGINYIAGSGNFKIKGNTVLYASWVKNNTATIIGTVTDGKAPVNNAVVTLKGRGKTFITRTGTDGRYTIKNVPAGKGFTITITKAGYKASKIAGIQLMANRITSDMNVILKKLSSEKNITGFKVANQVGKAVIDMKNYKIIFHVKYGTNIKNLAPSIVVSQEAAITPGSGIKKNFTYTVSYTVKAEDGTKQVWIVKCIIDPKK